MIRTDDTITFERNEVVILPSEFEWQEITTWSDTYKGWRVFVKVVTKRGIVD